MDPFPGQPTKGARVYVYGVELSCNHVLELGTAMDGETGYARLEELPKRRDGWPAKMTCPDCPGSAMATRRKVVRTFVMLSTEIPVPRVIR